MKDKLRELAERWKRAENECYDRDGVRACADELLAVLDAERIEADERAVPTLHVRCEVHAEDGISGSTYLNVTRVEMEDDGSFTAVTDHWPNPPAQAAQVDRSRETPRRQQAVETLLELGWQYNTERGWEEPAPTRPHSPDAADSGRVADDVRKAIEQIKRLSTIYLKAGTAATDGLFKLAVAHGANETAAAVLAHDANGEMNELQSCVYGMAALAAQGQGEAVAWMCETVNGYTAFSRDGKFPCNAGKISPLYLHAERARVPDGWGLKPSKATGDMVLAGIHENLSDPGPNVFNRIWAAMFAAAPSQPEGAESGA